jgi:hypothetical protein
MTDWIAALVAEMQRNPADVRFAAVLRVAEHYFGPPRIRGSHHNFPMPWGGDPRVNLQETKGGKAKEYQVVQLLRALSKLGVL